MAGANVRQVPMAAAQQRAQQIKRIHVLRGQLRQTEDEYRDLIGHLFEGKRSSTELSDAERERLLDHLSRLVRAQRRARAAGPGQARPERKPLTPRQKKIFSLWQQLADRALVKDRRMSAVHSYVLRQTHVQRLEWLNSHQEATVIESLKSWLKRGAEVGNV